MPDPERFDLKETIVNTNSARLQKLYDSAQQWLQSFEKPETTSIISDKDIEQVSTTPDQLIRVWQSEGCTPVELTKIPLGQDFGEKIKGSNFVGFVLPTNEAEGLTVEDRAGFVELEDGTKVFLGADGVGGSYFGNIAAREVIVLMQSHLKEAQISSLNQAFDNPERFLRAMGTGVKQHQTIVEDHFRKTFADNPNIGGLIKDANAEKARKYGSVTTFYMVAISIDGDARFISVGDGVMEKITAEGQVEDLLPTERGYRPEGTFGTLHGFTGQYRAGTIQLNSGDTLLFGTDGMKHNLEGLQSAFRDPKHWPENINQVGDDLTVFAYHQEGDLNKPPAEKIIPSLETTTDPHDLISYLREYMKTPQEENVEARQKREGIIEDLRKRLAKSLNYPEELLTEKWDSVEKGINRQIPVLDLDELFGHLQVSRRIHQRNLTLLQKMYSQAHPRIQETIDGVENFCTFPEWQLGWDRATSAFYWSQHDNVPAVAQNYAWQDWTSARDLIWRLLQDSNQTADEELIQNVKRVYGYRQRLATPRQALQDYQMKLVTNAGIRIDFNGPAGATILTEEGWNEKNYLATREWPSSLEKLREITRTEPAVELVHHLDQFLQARPDPSSGYTHYQYGPPDYSETYHRELAIVNFISKIEPDTLRKIVSLYPPHAQEFVWNTITSCMNQKPADKYGDYTDAVYDAMLWKRLNGQKG